MDEPAVAKIVLDSQIHPRSISLKFNSDIIDQHELVAYAIGARAESITWGRKSSKTENVRVNFRNRQERNGFKGYIEAYLGTIPPTVLVEVLEFAVPLDPTTASSIIRNGATRILRINNVPPAFPPAELWRVAMKSKNCFKEIIIFKNGEPTLSYGLQFLSIAHAVNGRKQLALLEGLKSCEFSWFLNETDHAISKHLRVTGGGPTVMRIITSDGY